MRKIKRELKNFYQISIEPICSVFLDEYLMRKAMKILVKYRQELNALLINNTEHLIEHQWALCYPKGKQTTFYMYRKLPEEDIIKLIENFEKFTVRKVEPLFQLEGEGSI